MSRSGDGAVVDIMQALPALVFKNLGRLSLPAAAALMKTHHHQRTAATADEIWFAEHDPVYSTGYRQHSNDSEFIADIPVVATDRGGLTTYHAPGQLLCYFLFDLHRRKIGVRRFVREIEEGLISTLNTIAIDARREVGKPGVYIGMDKVGSVGLRVQQGVTRYGLAVNVCADLAPFQAISPCGESDRQMININHFYPDMTLTTFMPLIESTYRKIWN